MSAIRLARGYTGRDKIVKFEGCYHGHSDSLLVKAGSGMLDIGEPSSKASLPILPNIPSPFVTTTHKPSGTALRNLAMTSLV